MENPLITMTQECDEMMPEQLYDTKEGITIFTGSLEGVHALLTMRSDAWERKERLHEYVLFGTWHLDEFGQVGRITPTRSSAWSKDILPEIPDVLTDDEFRAFLRAYEGEGADTSIARILSGDDIIAPAGIPCAVCGEVWDLTNAIDVFATGVNQIEPLLEFVGRPIGEFTATLDCRVDGHYSLHLSEGLLRNDRFIDLTPHPRLQGRVENEHGWVTLVQLGSDYVIQDGDEVSVRGTHYEHTRCHASVLAARRRGEFTSMFLLAGYQQVRPIPVQNRYGESEYGGPWFEVTTEFGVITIGWRRHVINIDWGATGRDLAGLFEDAGSSRALHDVHAFEIKQAVDYLTQIREGMMRESTVVS